MRGILNHSPIIDRRRAAGQAFKNFKICDKMYVFKIYLPCVVSIYFSIIYFIATVSLISAQSRPFSTSNNRIKAVDSQRRFAMAVKC